MAWPAPLPRAPGTTVGIPTPSDLEVRLHLRRGRTDTTRHSQQTAADRASGHDGCPQLVRWGSTRCAKASTERIASLEAPARAAWPAAGDSRLSACVYTSRLAEKTPVRLMYLRGGLGSLLITSYAFKAHFRLTAHAHRSSFLNILGVFIAGQPSLP